jgi:hypothetical protein
LAQEAGAVLLTDERETTTGIVPERLIDAELLVEEARQRQRRRQRRQAAALAAAMIVAGLGIAATRIVWGRNAPSAQKPPLVLPLARQQPGVIYEKVEMVIRTPHLPTVRRTGEIWFSTAAPAAYRELLTIPGRAPFEVGAGPDRTPMFGPEQLVYLYDAKADTIYRTGAYLSPARAPGLRTRFQRLLAHPGEVQVGTRRFEGHRVYVARSYGTTAFGWTSDTEYVDTATYQPLLSVTTGPGLRSTVRVLVYRTLPATTANLRLTSLPRSHPSARRRAAPPTIDALYGEANRIGTFGGSDLGPFDNGPFGNS